MKNQPFSVTGEYVEKLKSTEQNSIQEKDILPYSQYIPKYVQKNWKKIFSKQIYGFGKDILYKKNLLLEYGFTIQKPPIPAQGTSQYSITEQDDQIILWGFGMLFATKNNGLFLWRHEFKPKLINVNSIPSHLWEPSQLQQKSTIPKTTDEIFLMLELLVKSMKWLEKYEKWILKICGDKYRNESLQGQYSSKASAVKLDEKWSELSTRFTKILKTFEPEQNFEQVKSNPIQPNLEQPSQSIIQPNPKQSSQNTKKVCGACGDSWKEEVSFCPSCGWEGLPC